MKKIFLTWLCLGLLTVLSGCASAEEISPTNLVILSGYHANAPVPRFESIVDEVMDTCLGYGSVSVLVNDGEPYMAFQQVFEKPSKDISESKRKSIATSQAQSVYDALSASAAKTPECDFLGALQLAKRALSTQEGNKKLLILDSGFSTAGLLDLTQNNLLDADPQTVGSLLKERRALPDLTGVEIIWMGLGDVEKPQDTPSAATRQKLKELYQAILDECGASVTFDETLSSGQTAGESLPSVTPVTLLEEPALLTSSTAVVFTEKELAFRPDSTELADPAQAKEALAPVTEYLLSDSGHQLLLAGTTATVGNQQDCIQFSAARALSVKEYLVSAGVSSRQIQTLGLGYENRFHVPDTNPDGTLNENASVNRSVIVLPMDSPLAVELLEGQ